MTRVAGSIPITSDLSLTFDRDIENFGVQIGGHTVTLRDRQLRVTHVYSQNVVLSIPATIPEDPDVRV